MVTPDLAAATLGVDLGATDSEIRRAYKRLAQLNHPDHGGDPSVMANINEAYRRMLGHTEPRQTDEGGIDYKSLDVDDSFETWEDTMWPEPPPGLAGMGRLLLALVVLPVALFAFLVVTVLLVISSFT